MLSLLFKKIQCGGVMKAINEKRINYLLECSFLFYFIYYFYRLYSFLGETYFWADENFHAYISYLILATHQIPFILPDAIYGSFENSYPPLFHILSALVWSLTGIWALKYINIVLLFLILLSFYILIRKYYGPTEGIITCLVLSLSPIVASYTLRFMTDMLSMGLMAFSFFFILLGLKKTEKFFAIISGVFTGLLMLTKQVGFVVFGFYVMLFLWLIFMKKRKDSRVMLCAIGVTSCIYVPYLILSIFNKVNVLNFLVFWVGNESEWATEAIKSFRRYDFSFKEFVYLFYHGNGFVLSLSLLLTAVYFIKVRMKEPPIHYIFVMVVYLAGIMVLWHITSTRHTIALLPPIAFLTGYVLTKISDKKMIRQAEILLLLVIALYSTYRMPNYRQLNNAGQSFLTLTKLVSEDNSKKGRIFCIYAFDVLMYTGKPVIWPFPNLNDIPVALVEKQKSGEFHKLLKEYQIKYIVIDKTRIKRTERFDGMSYPHYFIHNCNLLGQQGKISLISFPGAKDLMLLKVNDTFVPE
jgi:4-amino-4-deoxy-L-arabinose transferase-like glycosyltransferase